MWEEVLVRRALRIVFALIGMAVLVSVAGILLLYLAVSRAPSVAQRSTLVLRPNGELPEVAGGGFGTPFLGGRAGRIRGVICSLHKSNSEARTAKVLAM